MKIAEYARHLRDLDRKVVRYAAEQSWQDLAAAASEYVDIRRRLITSALQFSVVTTRDSDAAFVLRRLGHRYVLPADGVLDRVTRSSSKEDSSTEDLGDRELEDLGQQLFHSWTSHIDFARALLDLRPLVLTAPVSGPLDRLVREARDCYALQQYDAVYGLCRSAIEAAGRDIARHLEGIAEPTQGIVRIDPPWYEIRDLVAAGPLLKRVKALYRNLCGVVHAARRAVQNEARGVYHETIETIEALYEWNGIR